MTPALETYRERPHWSFSAINQLLNICSLQYHFERETEAEPAFRSVALAFGSAFHRAMEHVGRYRMEHGDPPQLAEVQDLFADAWDRQNQHDVRYGEKHSYESCQREGINLVSCALEHLDLDEEVLAVNEAFCVPLYRQDGTALDDPLVGEIDQVVRVGERIVLTDWKTASRRWSKNQAQNSLQATAYLSAYRTLYPGLEFEASGMDFRFDVVVKNKTPVFESHLTTRIDEDFTRLTAIVAQAEALRDSRIRFPADGSFYCPGCAFKRQCRTWTGSKPVNETEDHAAIPASSAETAPAVPALAAALAA